MGTCCLGHFSFPEQIFKEKKKNLKKKLPLIVAALSRATSMGKLPMKICSRYVVNVFSKSGRETEMWEAIAQKEVAEISILWEIK